MTKILDSALTYLEKGWSVIPVDTKTKGSLVEWTTFQKRRPTIDEVTKWFTKWPEAGVAIVTGEISGLVVIDVDVKEGKRAFENLFGKVNTLLCKTRKGTHYFFQHPKGREISNEVRVAPGIDVRADGGYVQTAPSPGYNWVDESVTIAPYPYEQASGIKEKYKGLKKLLETFTNIPDGKRNDSIRDLAGHLLGKKIGLSYEEALVICESINLAECKPPLDFEEVERTVKSINKAEQEQRAAEVKSFSFTSFNLITEEKLEWLWPGVLPVGKVSLIIGDPGHGKSMLSIDMAARISAGTGFPDGTPVDAGEVLMVFCEDGAGDTVKPRLRGAGANLEKVRHLTITDRWLDLTTDMTNLIKIIKQINAKLLIIDPVSAYLGKVNSWKDDEVRKLMATLGLCAEKTGCAILGIMHLNKKVSSNALDRGMGSIAFSAVARSVFLVGAHPGEGDERKILAPVKANLTEKSNSLVFRILSNEEGIPQIQWEGESPYTVREILAAEAIGTNNDSYLEHTMNFLRRELATGKQLITNLYTKAKKENISPNMLRQAKSKLPIQTNTDKTWELIEQDTDPYNVLGI